MKLPPSSSRFGREGRRQRAIRSTGTSKSASGRTRPVSLGPTRLATSGELSSVVARSVSLAIEVLHPSLPTPSKLANAIQACQRHLCRTVQSGSQRSTAPRMLCKPRFSARSNVQVHCPGSSLRMDSCAPGADHGDGSGVDRSITGSTVRQRHRRKPPPRPARATRP